MVHNQVLGFTLFTKLYYLALLSLGHHVTTTLQDHNDYAGLDKITETPKILWS